MYSDLLLPHLQKEVTEEYFEICRYFLTTKQYGQPEDIVRMNFYRSLLQAEYPPCIPVKNKLDLEIICAQQNVRAKLSDTYSPDLLQKIVSSGVRQFFARMERYSAIDVYLRSTPVLFSFFSAMTPVIEKYLLELIEKEYCPDISKNPDGQLL